MVSLPHLHSFRVGESSMNVPLMGFSKDPSNKRVVLHLLGSVHRTQFLVLWDHSGYAAEFVNKVSNRGLFTNQQEWLLILPRNVTVEDVTRQLSQAHVYIDSEVTVCTYKENDNESFDLDEIWKVGKGAPFRIKPIGSWSWERGLQYLPVLEKYERRKDLQGFHLRVATIITMPYESLIQDNRLQNFQEGYVVDVWHTLQEQLNFSYTATDTLFGSLQSDGITWNGMVGMLQTDDADVAVAPLSITQIRSVSIDFTIPIQIVSTRLYIRRPVLESTWTLYFQPFDGNLWICMPTSMLVCAAMLWILCKFSYSIGTEDMTFTIGDTFWIMFSAHVQQAGVQEPKPVSGKIVFFSGFWSGMILYTCYSAILVSILTTRQPQLPFADFSGLLKKPDWNLGVRTNTALSDSLALAPQNSPERLSWEKVVGKDPINNLPNNNMEALDNVLKGKYAFFANKEYIIYLLQNILPIEKAMEIVDTRKDFLQRGIGFGLQKGSPYRKLFNHVLTKMTQKGHLNRLKRKWWPNIDREPAEPYPIPGFNEVFTVFIIWGSGVILSLMFCLGETYFRKNSKMHSDIIEDIWSSNVK
ncbi:glutamate receptor ionotropic, kainate glr-3-like isoform X2 [Palaemon carinicauda]